MCRPGIYRSMLTCHEVTILGDATLMLLRRSSVLRAWRVRNTGKRFLGIHTSLGVVEKFMSNPFQSHHHSHIDSPLYQRSRNDSK